MSDFNNESLFVDPEKDKLKIEERIIAKIEEMLPEADHDEVVAAVEADYEELLAEAKVKIHIPTLVENVAKQDVKNHRTPGHHLDQ